MSMGLENEIAQVLSKHEEIALGFLFGSLSRGAPRVRSDVDVAVAGPRPLRVPEKMELIEALAMLTGRPVDLVDLHAADPTLLRQVLTTGTLIYCTDHLLYAELIKRLVFDQADLMPYRKRILAERRRAWIGH